MRLVLVLVAVSAWLQLSQAHPQCLDFQPPYSNDDMAYCSEYKDFGCCTKQQDNRARKATIIGLDKLSDEEEKMTCDGYLRNVSCVTCSPYVAHIYDTEGGGEARVFPYLCQNYCIEAYTKCRLALMRMFRLQPWRSGLVSKHPRNEEELARDARAFCEHYIPEDSPYCYPRVLDGPDIEGFSTEQVGELGCICGQPVATRLRNPLAAVHAGDGSGRLFIAEQIGVVRILDRDNNLLSQAFLDITDRVIRVTRRGDERGLLGIAFHPEYSTNGLFYVHYSTLLSSRHNSRVSEFRVNPNNMNQAMRSSERILLTLRQPYSNHNGGQLFFKDSYLFISLGDGGGAGDPGRHGQNLGTLLGSVLRVDVDNRDPGKAYAIPPDNPFVNNSNAEPEIYAYGIRNAWRCSVDRGDRETGEGAGRIFCGDVGQNRFEEVDIIEKGGNYGWRIFEGHRCFDRQSVCNSMSSEVIPPIHAYPRSVGVSITGGYVYRGCAFPNLQGLYIFGDYGSGRLFALKENTTAGTWEHMELCMGDNFVCTDGLVGTRRARNILSFGEDEDGELYILATSNATPTSRSGVVYRIIDPSRRSPPGSC